MNLKSLLEKMIAAAMSQDKRVFLDLNRQFDEAVPMNIPGYNDYDNLRQSCLFCFNFPRLYQTCLADARQRFQSLYS